MTERLLQFIWQFQYFNQGELHTAGGEAMEVLFPGQLNTNQGPDFINAKIKIAGTTWAGSVELHIYASGWDKHQHGLDKNYNNVILHVVWENDLKEEAIPVLELKERVSKILLQRYGELMNAASFIPCEKMIGTVRDLTWKSWKDRLVAERLIRKAANIEDYLQQNNYHWEETFWWLLARNFGTKVNSDGFEAMARSIPLTILSKHKNQVLKLEALFLGQAGLLQEKFRDDYPLLLQKEYTFYKNKLGLQPTRSPVFFLRMRPGNFPTIRLAQLAMLVHESAHLFSKIKGANALKEVKAWLDVTANDYWHYHYRFDEPSPFKKKNLGDAMVDNIIINTVVPVLFAYGNYQDEQKYREKALDWLEKTTGENNSITKGFQQIGVENRNAFDSQALIELETRYCNNKKCLSCGIGNAILKN